MVYDRAGEAEDLADWPRPGGCVYTAFRLDREDVAGSGRSAKRAPRVAGPTRCDDLPRGRSQSPRWRTPSRTQWARFDDDRALIGLKIVLLANLGILVAALDLAI